MRSLDDVRADLDAVDADLVALVAARLRLAREAGAIKRAAGRGVVDAAREAQTKTQRAAWAAAHGVDADLVEGVFAVLVEAARAAQR